MDLSPLRLALVLLPKLPMLARETLLHVLHLSETGKYLDLNGHLTIAVLRSFMEPGAVDSVTSVQRSTLRDPGVKGRIWVSQYATPVPPEAGVRDALLSAIRGVQGPDFKGRVRVPELVSVQGEWTGYRPDVGKDAVPPGISDVDKYKEMMASCTTALTVLYFHGGAYYLLDPCTHRDTTKKLAKLTGGRCYSVRYRLAPQNPFPAALLDALVSYLTLLYPPPASFHEPVPPEHIVFAGDSAGGNLSLALMQTILELRRQRRTIKWFGEERKVPVPLPAGVAVNSPWLDITLSTPSWAKQSSFDYLPNSEAHFSLGMPPCEAWPATPPRLSMYADDDFLAHPLVTLTMVTSWHGAPPVYICAGWEHISDEIKYVASAMHRDSVKVVFEEFQGMAHCFAMVLPSLAESRRCFQAWSDFIKEVVNDTPNVTSRAVSIRAKSLQEDTLQLATLCPMDTAEVQRRVLDHIAERLAKAEQSQAKL